MPAPATRAATISLTGATQPYARIGPGAHGRRAGLVTRRHKKPENWLNGLAGSGHGIAEQEVLEPADIGVEALLMGLRLGEGVDLARIAGLAQRAPAELVDGRRNRLPRQHGLMEVEGNRLRATPRGMLLLDAILAEVVRT